ncbi:MAG: porin family protein [Rhizobiales bacterium]|nr:porin family protein [Hyphomicrobiales bacterium]
MTQFRISTAMATSLLALCLATGGAAAADLSKNKGYGSNPYGSSYGNSGSGGSSFSGNWQGAYFGGNIGGGFGKAGVNRISGIAGGLQAGYNWQSDRFVFGLEADGSGSDVISRSVADTYRQNWLASGRGRAGYLIANNLMLYTTAGMGLAGTEYKSTTGTKSLTAMGWVAGIGAEFQVDQRFTLRGEVLHYDLNSYTYPASTGPQSIGATNNLLRVGGNYRF